LLLVGGTINVIVNITLDLVLGLWLGVAGMAIASSVSQGLVALLFLIRLARSEDGFALRPAARTFGQAVLASLPVTLMVGAISWLGLVPIGVLPGTFGLVAFGVVGAVGYLLVASWIGMSEPLVIARQLLARLSHPRHA
jgi:putative peptidoglycan lipid II flippase